MKLAFFLQRGLYNVDYRLYKVHPGFRKFIKNKDKVTQVTSRNFCLCQQLFTIKQFRMETRLFLKLHTLQSSPRSFWKSLKKFCKLKTIYDLIVFTILKRSVNFLYVVEFLANFNLEIDITFVLSFKKYQNYIFEKAYMKTSKYVEIQILTTIQQKNTALSKT